ncbi:RHS repeat protein [Escherichia coli]|uniref:RHS repeat protein n=1 Tax=Escherichia coli TaxID=562 RepID=UPI0022263122|nr:RHS repeat protein [Escherichia coli]MCW3429184.1 RHS repeat protein [Escherichia coli]MCW7158553.1 RHS repeat protein [Escherichia coli]MCW7400060.1 RHS repeat protein [Escherichia coli]
MSGKPAARQGDMTQYGGSIVQGSAGVRIGAPTGVACSVCPGGVTSGHPVNPLLGAKVLPGETDLALPGPLPFILSRTYSSYRTKTPAPVGSLGPGWKMPADIRLQLRDNTLILSDNGGRSLYFEHLFPGEDGYSRSESLWLVRGGVAKLDEGHRLAALWQALPEELRLSPHRYLATNSPQGPWWVLDRLIQETGFDGRTQRYHHDLTGKLIRSEDEGLVTHWHYDEADRLTHRIVKGETAERWRYDERGWLTDISHISEGHRVTVHYGYDEKGRLTGERQTVHHPETEALLWQHETRHAYNAQGLANRCIPDSLPAVEWLTYGSGWLAGMKLGDTPLVDFTRDRLHRETLRSFGHYELTTAYTPAGQLQSQHLNSLLSDRDYTWNDNGELIRISSPRQTRSYSYSDSGRLTGVHTTAANLDIRIPYATDPAGNRLPDPELHPDSTLSMWPDNRIARDAHYLYRYDRHGRLTEKTDLIPEGVIRTDDERTHRYHYDSQHRLVHYTRTQYAEPLVESRYLYDPLGRRVAKRVWRRERDLTGWMSLSRKPEVTWYGWDGDRLTTIQNDRTRIQTIYQPGSFTPLIRVETATGELAKTQRRSLADALQQSGGEDGGSVVFPPVLVQMLDRLESEILADRVSEESRRWLASCGLTVEQMQNQMDPVYTPVRKIHLYHCDHRGLPLALISAEGATEWCAEYDEWGNLLNEENPHQLQQLIRLPGQQYDEESGLYYNRHRYYDPLQGRYITQDPIGLKGGWNFYQYPLNPISNIDPLGLETLKCIKPLHSMGGTGERSGPDIWGNPFYHQYLCVPDGKGDYTCGGQDQRGESKGDGLWGPGKASNDTKEAAGRCDLVETDNSCVENCLKGKFKEVRPRYSVLPDIFTPINLGLFKNCQDWSNDSLETCKMKCSGNNIGRFIRFVFTGVM